MMHSHPKENYVRLGLSLVLILVVMDDALALW